MKRSTTVVRMLHGLVLGVALAACSDSPVAPADDPAVSLAKGGATVTEFTATDLAAGLVDPGTAEQRDGHLMVRGAVINNYVLSSDQPQLDCLSTTTINANLRLADGTGSYWGKLECVSLSGEGLWQGSWTGKREMTGTDPLTWLTTLKIVLQGRGGDIDGLQVRAEELNELKFTDPWYPGAFGLSPVGSISGTILDPHP